MSIIKVKGHQVGVDAVTASNNFSLEVPSTPNGTMKLARGNSGSTTADIMTVGTDNSVTFAGKVVNAVGNSGSADFRNRLINGNFIVDQRSTGATNTDSAFVVDRWILRNAANNANFGAQLNLSSLPGARTQMNFNVTTGFSPITGGYHGIEQKIEGINVGDLQWGTSGAIPITISFYVYCNILGTFSVSVRNSAANRSYMAPFTVTAINTWQYVTLTVPGDTTGTWLKDLNIGIDIWFALAVGATYAAPTANVWAAANYVGISGQTQLTATSGATLVLAAVQVEAGTVATPFDNRPYGLELLLCQRYYATGNCAAIGYALAGGGQLVPVTWPTTMRVAPTLGYTATTTTNVTTFDIRNPTTTNAYWYSISPSTATYDWRGNWTANAEL